MAVVGTYWGSFEPSLPGHYLVNLAAGDSLSVFLVHAATYLGFTLPGVLLSRVLAAWDGAALGMVPRARLTLAPV